MIKRAVFAASLTALAFGPGGAWAQEAAVELFVSGDPIEAIETEPDAYLYLEPSVPEAYAQSGGAVGNLAQGWSMLGREDRGAKAGSNEYRPRVCEPVEGAARTREDVIDAIVERARETRIVIVNESHEVTLHRAFSRRLIERLRPLGFTVFAAETFQNRHGEPDPVEQSAALDYPLGADGHYLRDPVYGELVRSAKSLGYRLAAYEIVRDPERARAEDIDARIAQREAAQAANLVALLETMGPDEKLFVHVGYAHAREAQSQRKNGFDTTWMAGRLKRLTGIDPLTIAQTECRGSSDDVRFSKPRGEYDTGFDWLVDHPVATFTHGRPHWRFEDGYRPVDIPEPYASAKETLVIEAFYEGEPFEAVPADRIWVEPGEDVKLALRPGRYTVRAVRPATLPPIPEPPATPE